MENLKIVATAQFAVNLRLEVPEDPSQPVVVCPVLRLDRFILRLREKKPQLPVERRVMRQDRRKQDKADSAQHAEVNCSDQQAQQTPHPGSIVEARIPSAVIAAIAASNGCTMILNGITQFEFILKPFITDMEPILVLNAAKRVMWFHATRFGFQISAETQ